MSHLDDDDESVSAATVPPRCLPAVGQVLDLAGDDLRYREAALRLRVSEIRADISGWYGGQWVWLEGHELDLGGQPIAWQQQLVRVSAVERNRVDA